MVAASRSEESLAELEASLDGAPGRVVTLALDCATREAPQQVMSVAERELGGVDILVNNLGTGTFEHDWNTGDDEWERIININLYSAVRLHPRVRTGNEGARLGAHHQHVLGQRSQRPAPWVTTTRRRPA